MAYNVPSYDVKKITFGPGRVYLGAEGVTPTIEIGAVKGDATLSIKRTTLDVLQGSPQTLIQQYVTKEEITLKFTGIEWNMNGLAFVLGAGTTTLVGATDILEFGGDMNVANYALLYRHIMPDGSTLDFELYKVQGTGEVEVSLKETDVHEITYEFVVLEGTTNFANSTLAAKKKLAKFFRVKA